MEREAQKGTCEMIYSDVLDFFRLFLAEFCARPYRSRNENSKFSYK